MVKLMTIIFALCIPLTAFVVGFLVLKSVQLGLRWQIQTNKEQQPTLEIKNPIQPIIEAKQTERQEQQFQNILDEYLNGADDKGR
jgi:predicted PurR-regulated permease PerM